MNFRYDSPSSSVVVALLAALIAGCGGNPSGYPDTASVTGTVTLDGAPLEGATVTFAPSEGRSSNGTTDAAGKYSLKFTGEIEGAVLGAHSVSVFKKIPDPTFVAPATPKPTDPDELVAVPEPDMIESIPERYRGPKSELTAEVKAEDNVFDFELSSE